MRKTSKSSQLKLILLTPVFILLSHYFIVFMHEYAHAVIAWMLGYKSSPLDINYGGTSLANLLMLTNIDQNVDNDIIYNLGHTWHVAVIAFAGPGITLLLYFVTAWLMMKNKIRHHMYLLYFLFFCNMWTLGGTYAYVPVRTFTTHGVMVDVLDIEQSLQISPWWIYFFFGYLVALMMWQFFTESMIRVYVNLGMKSTAARASLMIVCVFILFGYCGLAGFFNHGEISHFISVTSILAIPGIILMLWPTREWVQNAIPRFARGNQ